MSTRIFRFILAVMMLAIAGITSAYAGNQNEPIRVATYNIEWFGGQGSSPERIERLKRVIDLLDADVIGLQEIADEDALRLIFSEDEWQIMIDEGSNDNQDVALAVRLPFMMVGHEGAANIDAEDENFLFPSDDSSNNFFFPNQRDILFSEIQIPGSDRTVFVMVQHAKSRSGGRTTTDPRREGASLLIVQEIERRFDGEAIILLGDFNDNPDDVSLNILETGDADAVAGPDDNSDDRFFVNLTQPLLAEDHVSWGLTEDDIENGLIITSVEGSRGHNNETRGTSGVIAPILFDQILASSVMLDEYTVTLTEVFDDPVAQEGHASGQTVVPREYASDHLPVLVELTFGVTVPDEGTPVIVVSPQPAIPQVRIVELLPNPVGDDAGHETVTLKNFGDQDVSLVGWRLVDRAGNEFDLSGSLAVGEELTITLPAGELPLNNSGGDEVSLFADDGSEQDRVHYSSSQAASGARITFGR